MRKNVSLLLLLSLIFCMSACGKKTDSPAVSSEPEQMEFTEIQWPDTEIAKLMPVPKSTIGNIGWSQSYGFVIYIAETSQDDYATYVSECEELGFTLNARKGDDYFYADNTDGYHVAVNYQEDDVMFVRIDEPKDESPEPTTDPATSTTEPPPDSSLDISTPPSMTEPSGEETPPAESNSLYYSTNNLEQAKNGNSGVFAYKLNGSNYDRYWIINFDEGCAYYYIYPGNSSCERVQIDDGNGDLNSYITVTYHDGDDFWQYGLCFKRARQPDRLIQSEEDGTQYEFTATDLNDALKIRDGLEIVDY